MRRLITSGMLMAAIVPVGMSNLAAADVITLKSGAVLQGTGQLMTETAVWMRCSSNMVHVNEVLTFAVVNG